MSSFFTCESFFDGQELHGPRRIERNEIGEIVRIDPHSGSCEYSIISPGFVDVQMNGFSQVDVATCDYSEFLELDASLAARGTTSWLGTIVSAPLESMSHQLNRLSEFCKQTDSHGCIGVHMEGPFLGNAPGAHRTKHIVPANDDFLESLPDCVRIVTMAPEQEGVLDAIAGLVDRGIVVSVGHSRCTAAEFLEAQQRGARMVTHLFNGMSEVHHRNDGVALMALTLDSMTVGVIADLVHVRAEALNLAFRSKKPGTVCLVSDSVAWKSPWAVHNKVEIQHGAPRLPDGTLAGASTPLAVGVRHCVTSAGVDVEMALRAATSTPANLMGRADIGHIRRGQRCDFVCLDSELSVVKTVRRLPSVRG